MYNSVVVYCSYSFVFSTPFTFAKQERGDKGMTNTFLMFIRTQTSYHHFLLKLNTIKQKKHKIMSNLIRVSQSILYLKQ